MEDLQDLWSEHIHPLKLTNELQTITQKLTADLGFSSTLNIKQCMKLCFAYFPYLLQLPPQPGIGSNLPSSLGRRLCSLGFWSWWLNNYPAVSARKIERFSCNAGSKLILIKLYKSSRLASLNHDVFAHHYQNRWQKWSYDVEDQTQSFAVKIKPLAWSDLYALYPLEDKRREKRQEK